MAEALAALASGMAVTQLVSQVGSGIGKLRSLLQQIRNVPPMMASLVQQLDLLVLLLQEAETIQSTVSLSGLSDATLKLCIQHCRQSSQAIGDMVTTLNHEINCTKRRRLSASLKVILTKDTLARLEKDLAGAIRLLMLAQQLYMTAVFRHNHEYLIELLTRAVPHRQPDCQDSPCQHATADKQVDSDDAQSQTRTTYVQQNSTAAEKWRGPPSSWRSQFLGFTVRLQRAGDDFCARFYCPRWVASFAWELQVAKASSGWRMYVASYPIRARDSEPFVYVRNGDLDRLLECFGRRAASPFDQDMNGWSLVHHAALGQHIDICKSLLLMGADVNHRAGHKMTVLRCFDSATPDTPPSQAIMDFKMYLLSRGAEYECYEGEPPDQQLTAPYQGTTESFLLLQSHLFPHYYCDLIQVRLRCALQIALNPWRDAAEFRVSLRKDGEICGKDVARSVECELPVLNLALLGLSIRLQSATTVADVPEWQSLVRIALSHSQIASDFVPLPVLDTSYIKSTCTGQVEKATPLFCVIIGNSRGAEDIGDCWEGSVDCAIQLWAETARAAGLDLDHYGSAEKNDFDNNTRHNWFHLGRKAWTKGIARVERLCLDTPVEPWRLSWDPCMGDVWSQDNNFVTKECDGVPGAWVEDSLSERKLPLDDSFLAIDIEDDPVKAKLGAWNGSSPQQGERYYRGFCCASCPAAWPDVMSISGLLTAGCF